MLNKGCNGFLFGVHCVEEGDRIPPLQSYGQVIIIIITLKLCSPTLTMKTVASVLIKQSIRELISKKNDLVQTAAVEVGLVWRKYIFMTRQPTADIMIQYCYFNIVTLHI